MTFLAFLKFWTEIHVLPFRLLPPRDVKGTASSLGELRRGSEFGTPPTWWISKGQAPSRLFWSSCVIIWLFLRGAVVLNVRPQAQHLRLKHNATFREPPIAHPPYLNLGFGPAMAEL